MADQRTMAQLLQAPIEGHEDAIVVPAITADNFELKHGLLTLVQNNQFFGHDKEDPHAHVRYFNKITSTLKFPNVLNTSIKLMLFPFSLEGAARIWLEKEPPRSIFTWDDLVSKFINQFFPPSKTTNLRNEITNFQQRFDESFTEARDRFKDLLRACPHHGFSELHQLDTFYNALNLKDQDSLNSAAGGNFLDKMPRECLAILESKSKVCYSRNKPVVAKVSTNTSTSGISPDVAELKDIVKALLLDKKGQNQSPAPMKAVEESCVTFGGAHSYHNCPATDGNFYRDNIQEFVSQAFAVNYNQGNTSYRPPMMSNQIRPPGPVYQPPVFQPPAYQALAYQAPAPQTQGVSKEDFSANVKANDAVMRNMQTQGMFMIPCDFPGMAESLALADLGASINLMPFSVWKRLSLPDLTPTCMTLELADRSISCPVGVSEDVYVKIGSFHFSADFVVVDFDADPRVPLILRRSFLKTERALIDVFEGELTLRVGKVAITFNLDQTSRYSANYSEIMAKRIDVINMACEENSDFLLEEVDAFLAIEDDPTSFEFYQPYLNLEGDILLLETFLNDDPSLPPPNQGNYLPEVRKELKIYKAKSDKSLVDETPEVELKDLPPHIEYAFLEGDDKLPVIIAKYLSVEEKTALIMVLKSHKRAIAWKLSNIKGIDPEFYTHKILMEKDFELAVQHQRRVNPKIHDVIKQEVIKILEVGLIYLIYDSPWVSPVHCVPKKGGFTVVENEKNELIPTRLVMVISKFPSIRKIRRKPPSPAHTERLLIATCLLGYAMLQTRFRVMMLKRCEDTNLCLNWEKSHFMVKEGIVLGQKISKQGITVDKAEVDVITKLPHPTTVNAPILIASNWDMPFELMCDASDYAICAVLGQRQDKHFRPIHYASKTMTEAESNYTTTEKEMLAVVYAFEKFRSYLIMNKSIVYMDHSALKYLFAKKDSKERLLRWVLLLQEFTFKVIDTKGAENLAADHLSRLENPHQNVLDPKEINESFPHETLNLVSTRGNQCTAWFADFANYHDGNFIVKGMSSQQKSKFFKDVKHYFWDDSFLFKFVLIKSSEGVYQARKLLKSSRLAIIAYRRKVQINELNKLRDQAYTNSLIFKEKTKRLHDSKIKNRVFNIGNRVLLFNSRLKIFSDKLKSRWSGPFTISQVYPYGTVELSQPDGPNFKVNGHRLKHYFGEDVPKLIVHDLQTFPRDH
nr:reverse transcriptase domain-containing protein [Tanacetum cinerariifolium]